MEIITMIYVSLLTIVSVVAATKIVDEIYIEEYDRNRRE